MDEREAWQNFYATGKIEDYIRYSQLKSQAGQRGFSGLQTGWETEGRDRLSGSFPPLAAKEDAGEDTNTGAGHSGADHRGKRPFGHSFDP